MKTARCATLVLLVTCWSGEALQAQSRAANPIEQKLTQNRWEVETERGQRSWGDIWFREGHEFSTMNGPQGAWKVTGPRTVELGTVYVVEFSPELESFVVSKKDGSGKVASGRRFGAKVATPLPVATVIQPPRAPVPAAAIGDALFTTVSIAEIANRPLDHLQKKPSGRVTYAGVPFEFSDPPRAFTTQNRFNRNLATTATIPVNVARPAALRLLVAATAAGKAEHRGKEIGVLKLGFADGSSFEVALKAGKVFRPETWSYDDDNLPTPPGDEAVKVVNVIAEPQNRGRPAKAFLDMLVIDLPASKLITALTSITVTDTSQESTGSMEPGLEIIAITVGQGMPPSAPIAPIAPIAPAVAAARTAPDPLGLNRPVPLTDQPLAITLPPLPGGAPVRPAQPPPVAVPSPMRGRFGAGRSAAILESQMKPATENAVVKGLGWLQKNQNPDGSWGASNKSAMTGFALLCFLGHGETPASPVYGPAVRQGIDWLMKTGTAADGKFATFNQSGVYEHGIATYALAEYFALSRDAAVNPLLKQAVTYIVDGQGKGGGWMYSYDKTADDLSVTGWQFQALKAAYLGKLDVPGIEQTLDRASAYIARVKGPKGGYGYRSAGDKYSLSGVGILCQLLWKGEHMALRKGVDFILAETEKSEPVKFAGEKADLYAWYYHTQTCFAFGGVAWTKWKQWYQDEIAGAQNPDGSWPETGGNMLRTLQGGTSSSALVYRTSLCTLMLETFYRNLPAIRK